MHYVDVGVNATPQWL